MNDNPIKPRRRWLSRSPNRSIIVDTQDIKLRVSRRAQVAALGPLVKKLAIAAVTTIVAGVMAWRC